MTCENNQKKENRILKNSIIKQANQNTENTMFEEVFEKLNDVGKQIAFTQLQALLDAGIYAKTPCETWTGYYHGVKKEGNIMFPEWG